MINPQLIVLFTHCSEVDKTQKPPKVINVGAKLHNKEFKPLQACGSDAERFAKMEEVLKSLGIDLKADSKAVDYIINGERTAEKTADEQTAEEKTEKTEDQSEEKSEEQSEEKEHDTVLPGTAEQGAEQPKSSDSLAKEECIRYIRDNMDRFETWLELLSSAKANNAGYQFLEQNDFDALHEEFDRINSNDSLEP